MIAMITKEYLFIFSIDWSRLASNYCRFSFFVLNYINLLTLSYPSISSTVVVIEVIKVVLFIVVVVVVEIVVVGVLYLQLF